MRRGAATITDGVWRTAIAAETYQRLVNLDELDEDATRNLMTALEKQGDSAGAKRAYRRLATALKRELGETPGF